MAILDKGIDYAYLHLEGVTEVPAEEVAAYIQQVEEEVIPAINRILDAKAEGARATRNQIVY
ncbi:MAG: hypothetical protein QG650_921 [Patescibacteria group bacterium]|nr:hypothetical protein [Patescibacteria group bacterium]